MDTSFGKDRFCYNHSVLDIHLRFSLKLNVCLEDEKDFVNCFLCILTTGTINRGEDVKVTPIIFRVTMVNPFSTECQLMGLAGEVGGNGVFSPALPQGGIDNECQGGKFAIPRRHLSSIES